MQHIPASWEKEYTFQPNIRAAKDDWQLARKATYMYPPRSASAANKRNDARFVQQSTFGLTAHRHPVGLPKQPATGSFAPRPASALGPQPLAATEVPSSRADTYTALKSSYRPSTTPSSSAANASGRLGAALAAARSPTRAGASYAGTPHRFAGGEASELYTVTAADERRGTAGLGPHQTVGREHSAGAPYESRERMYAESVRDRSNAHLRSGAVEPEWERQRLVMDLVGAKTAARLVDQGYDPRYRPPGGLLDVRRGRRTVSARDRTAMTRQLFPENYKEKVLASSTSGKIASGAVRVRTPSSAQRQSSLGSGVVRSYAPPAADDRDGAEAVAFRGPPPYLREDDRMAEGLTRRGIEANWGRSGRSDDAPLPSSAADRAGMYAVAGQAMGGGGDAHPFDTIASRYAHTSSPASSHGPTADASYYYGAHQHRRPSTSGGGGSSLFAGAEVSVFHGRNGPVLVAPVLETALPLSASGAEALAATALMQNSRAHHSDAYSVPLSSSLPRASGAESVYSPPRPHSMGAPRDRSYLGGVGGDHHTSATSVGLSPNRLDTTPPPLPAARWGAAVEGRGAGVRVLAGRAGPVIVDSDDEEGEGQGRRPLETFRDDRDVFVRLDSTGVAGGDGLGRSGYGDGRRPSSGGSASTAYVRLSPQQVREAQQQLDSPVRGASRGGSDSFVNPHWERRIGANGSFGVPQQSISTSSNGNTYGYGQSNASTSVSYGLLRPTTHDVYYPGGLRQ